MPNFVTFTSNYNNNHLWQILTEPYSWRFLLSTWTTTDTPRQKEDKGKVASTKRSSTCKRRNKRAFIMLMVQYLKFSVEEYMKLVPVYYDKETVIHLVWHRNMCPWYTCAVFFVPALTYSVSLSQFFYLHNCDLGYSWGLLSKLSFVYAPVRSDVEAWKLKQRLAIGLTLKVAKLVFVRSQLDILL